MTSLSFRGNLDRHIAQMQATRNNPNRAEPVAPTAPSAFRQRLVELHNTTVVSAPLNGAIGARMEMSKCEMQNNTMKEKKEEVSAKYQASEEQAVALEKETLRIQLTLKDAEKQLLAAEAQPVQIETGVSARFGRPQIYNELEAKVRELQAQLIEKKAHSCRYRRAADGLRFDLDRLVSNIAAGDHRLSQLTAEYEAAKTKAGEPVTLYEPLADLPRKNWDVVTRTSNKVDRMQMEADLADDTTQQQGTEAKMTDMIAKRSGQGAASTNYPGLETGIWVPVSREEGIGEESLQDRYTREKEAALEEKKEAMRQSYIEREEDIPAWLKK